MRDRLPALPASGLMLLVAGAAVIWDPWGFNGFVAAKAAVAAIGTALIVGYLARRSAMILPAGGWLFVGGALGGVMLAAALASESVWRSLLGAPNRLEGLLAWAGFGAAFAAGMSLRRANRDAAAASLVDAAVAAVVVVGAAGLLEIAGVSVDAELITFEGRLRSTLGSPALLSGFLVLAAPLAALAWTRPGPWRWAGAAAAALAVVNLAAAQTRAAWIAVVAVCAAAALIAARGRLRMMIAVAAVAAAAVAVLSDRWRDFGRALRGRAAIWEVAVSTVADRPLLGNGPEMFAVSYGERVSDDTVREFGDVSLDRAHSGVLDFAASYGAVAGLLYVAGLAGVAMLAYRAVRSGDGFRAAAGIGVACYALMQQAFFPHTSTDMVWWLMVGYLAADSRVPALRLPRAGGALMLSVLCVVAVNAVSVARNDRLYQRSVDSASVSEAYGLLAQAASHRPFDDFSYIVMGDLLRLSTDTGIVADGIEHISDGAEHNEGNALVAIALIDAHLQAHRVTPDGGHAADAQRTAADLIAAQPANGVAYLKRGLASWYLEDLDQARSDWERAAYLLPHRPEPRDNLAVLDSVQ